MKDRKGVNLGGEGVEEELGGTEGGDSKIKIQYVRKSKKIHTFSKRFKNYK